LSFSDQYYTTFDPDELKSLVSRSVHLPTSIDCTLFPDSDSLSLMLYKDSSSDIIVHCTNCAETLSDVYISVVADHHFPCLGPIKSHDNFSNSYLCREDIQVSKSPFTQVISQGEQDCVYLSCVAYFEVVLSLPIFSDENQMSKRIENTLSLDSSFADLSIGIALPEFQLHEGKPGINVNSFGYCSYDGLLLHGEGKPIATDAPYTFGDTVGCGLLYPPLSSVQGSIFFTRNGHLVAQIESTFDDMLSHPWFPIVVSCIS
jgi:hypothetical protein